MMHGPEKSDPAIVAMKPTNKAEQPAAERSAAELEAAEPVERRAGTKGNADRQSTHRTQSRTSVSQALERIRKAASERKKERFTALEDKIVQRAVAALLSAIYEEDFLGFSYGFRPGRGTHDALDALCVGMHSKKVSFILDADIRSFFDEISQQWLIRFLEHRIGDRRIIRLIQKWLKAGILEDGVVAVSDRGGRGRVR